MPSYSDQRANPRFRCRCYATLDATHESWPAHLLNISSTGALVAVLQDHTLKPDQNLTITVEFDNEPDLDLSGAIAHVKDHYIGVKCVPLSEQESKRLHMKLEGLNQIRD